MKRDRRLIEGWFGPFQFRIDVLALVKPKPSPHTHGLTGGAMWQDRVGVDARDVGLSPGLPTVLPGGDDPPVFAGGMDGSRWDAEDLIGGGLFVELRCAFQVTANLGAKSGELLIGIVAQPQLHVDT